jgi:hypothetical protein
MQRYPRPGLTNPNDRDSDSLTATDPCSIPSAPPLRSRPLMLQSLAREVPSHGKGRIRSVF